MIKNRKQFYCCICHRGIKRNNRLLHQRYDGKETYGAFYQVEKYDFCDKCFRTFETWIIKYKGDSNGKSNN